FERASGALPAARRPGEHPRGESDDGGAVLPSRPPPGARPGCPSARGDDAEGPTAAEAGLVDAGGTRGERLQAGAGRSECRQGAGAEAGPLLRKDLLRPRGARVARERRARGDRPDRAAVSVPGRGEECARRLVSEPRRGRLGAGGAPEHGPVASDPTPAGREAARRRQPPLRRPPLAPEPERGLSDRAP